MVSINLTSRYFNLYVGSKLRSKQRLPLGIVRLVRGAANDSDAHLLLVGTAVCV